MTSLPDEPEPNTGPPPAKFLIPRHVMLRKTTVEAVADEQRETHAMRDTGRGTFPVVGKPIVSEKATITQSSISEAGGAQPADVLANVNTLPYKAVIAQQPTRELGSVQPVEVLTNVDTFPVEAVLNTSLPAPALHTHKFDFSWDEVDFAEQTTLILPALEIPLTTQPLKLARTEPQNYVVLIRNLLKSSGIYIVASLISPLVALVLTPFLTHNLSVRDYGVLAVLTTVIALTAGLTQLGLGSAFFRLYNYDYETQKDRLAVLSSTIILLCLVTLPITAAMSIGSPLLAGILLKDASFSASVKLTALTVLCQNLTIPGFSWLRADNRAAFYSTFSIANVMGTLGATVVLVGMLHMGINGALLANAGGYALVAVSTLPFALVRAGLHLPVDIVKGLLIFGLPNVASLLSVWILQLSDRYLLVLFGSLNQVGSYSVAYTLGGVLSTVVISPFMLAWPTTMYSIAKMENAASVFRMIFRWFSCLLLLAAYGLSLVSTGLLAFFFPPSYYASAPIIPIVALSIVFYGVYNMFLTGSSIRRKPWLAVIFTAGSALANILLNVVLIPFYGSVGAAFSTLFSYALLSLIAYLIVQRIYPVPYQIGLFLIGLLVGVALYLLGYLLALSQGRLLGWSIQVIGFCIYGGGLFLLVKAFSRDRKSTYQTN